MKNNKVSASGLANVNGKKVEFNFDSGFVTSDGGGLLVRQADRHLGLTNKVARCIDDTRVQGQVTHTQHKMLKQRIFGIMHGYPDVNDQNFLKNDIGFQTVVGEDTVLASSSSICRFENRATPKWAWDIHSVLVETFIESFNKPPKELILDFDATDDPVHGQQEGRFFHGYYNHYCFLPLYVFCGKYPLVAYLSGSNTDGAKNSRALLSLLVKRFREVWPEVRIILRADGGFCRPALMRWCEANDVQFIIGLSKNAVLKKMAEFQSHYAEVQYHSRKETQKVFATYNYGAKSWKRKRKVVGKAEHNINGSNLRFVVTNLPGCGQDLYQKIYCARGEMENRIKEQQLHLFADKTSCTKWWPNQFRLLLSTLGYVLFETIRRIGLSGTELAKAQAETIRTKLLKVGAVVLRNTRRIRFLMSSGFPFQELFRKAIESFAPS